MQWYYLQTNTTYFRNQLYTFVLQNLQKIQLDIQEDKFYFQYIRNKVMGILKHNPK